MPYRKQYIPLSTPLQLLKTILERQMLLWIKTNLMEHGII